MPIPSRKTKPQTGSRAAGHPELMQIELTPIDELKPYGNNARTHSEKQIAQIASSLKAFGCARASLGLNSPTILGASTSGTACA